MTPELKAAAERVRQLQAGGDSVAIYETRAKPSWHKGDWGRAEQLDWAQELYNNDCEALARMVLSEHLPDDDEPVTLDFMESVVPEDGSITIATHGEIGRVYLDEGYVADGIEIKDREQLRYLLKGLGR